MKKIEAIVLEKKLKNIKLGLLEAGFDYGVIVTHIEGRGTISPEGQKGRRVWGGKVYTPVLMPKVKVEMFVEDKDTARIVDVILEKAGEDRRTKPAGRWEALKGSRVSGKIFVMDVLQAIRISTGRKDDEALRPDESVQGAGT